MVGFGWLLTVLRRSVCLAQNSSRVCVTQTLQVYRCQPYNKKFKQDSTESSEKKVPRPKTVPVPKITLLLPDNSMTVTVLAEAERLAKRRNLTLVKVEDFNSKTQRPLYKLASSSSTLLEETTEAVENVKDSKKSKENKENFKDCKIVYLSAKIAEHDVRIKAKNMVKWLNKKHQVKVIINLNDNVEETIN
ncbi:uncharacterized protein LOC109855102 isoform X2 [Pseudomyrmex gracilis]|uniref:uncharacterized protein LOC109855102 isoform X2 n=1 Tax=Pseudomyrmex gracilis TaxID=219809 RepID=UPI000994F0BB|nr:uncharacterized protein LOC109855102 isoform X2 [Pseudomyrmex gracilis]